MDFLLEGFLNHRGVEPLFFSFEAKYVILYINGSLNWYSRKDLILFLELIGIADRIRTYIFNSITIKEVETLLGYDYIYKSTISLKLLAVN